MSSVQGVEAYVKRIYRERQERLQAIRVQVCALMGPEACLAFMQEVTEACLLSQDLGSMRRLLGDLKARGLKLPPEGEAHQTRG